MAVNSSIVDARRARLKEWIADRFAGNQADFQRATGINQGELSALLKDKSFGEKRALSLEGAAKMPAGYLVRPLEPVSQFDVPDDATMAQAVDLFYLMADMRPEDPNLRRLTWPKLKITARAIARLGSQGNREIVSYLLSEFQKV